jgi:AraC family transcriptional regulator
VREHIETNLETSVEIADLAAIAKLSPCHFARAFKLSVGTTPHEYLVDRRLEKAQELLAATDLPLAEIALATGFSDQSHFARRFRDHLGTTPSAFRRSMR